MKTIKGNYYDPFIKTLKENTNNNYHTENASLIVANFGNEADKSVMKKVLENHNKEGHLSYFVYNTEYYLVQSVLYKLEFDNPKLAKRIHSAI
jgi:hypothetical protein|tara:strand:- start:298 stop:576 length:279 start_codon:yes stop_codon:yes gene_type:complete